MLYSISIKKLNDRKNRCATDRSSSLLYFLSAGATLGFSLPVYNTSIPNTVHAVRRSLE